jgi:hypothetical protein
MRLIPIVVVIRLHALRIDWAGCKSPHAHVSPEKYGLPEADAQELRNFCNWRVPTDEGKAQQYLDAAGEMWGNTR